MHAAASAPSTSLRERKKKEVPMQIQVWANIQRPGDDGVLDGWIPLHQDLYTGSAIALPIQAQVLNVKAL